MAGCSDSVEVDFFTLQDCQRQMQERLEQEGKEPMIAAMQAKAYCRELQERNQKP
jgi:hypothetical protein